MVTQKLYEKKLVNFFQVTSGIDNNKRGAYQTDNLGDSTVGKVCAG